MTQNKILAAAVATALTMGSITAQAGTLTLTGPAPANIGPLAIEAVGSDLILPSSGDFDTSYTTGKVKDGYELTLTYTLTGAEWATEPGATNLKSSNTTDTLIGISETSATYALMVGGLGINNEVEIMLNFNDFQVQIKQAEFQDVGQTVNLNIGITGNISESDDLILLSTAVGATVSFKSDGEEKIDVAESGTKFTIKTDPTGKSASIGELNITDASAKGTDLTTDWSFTGTSGKKGTLTISSGSFAASLDHDEDDANKVLVFLGTDCSDSTNSIPATRVDNETTATWDLENSNLNDIAIATANTTSDSNYKICVSVANDNQTAINETKEPPKALLTLEYGGSSELSYDGALRHLKRNGTICTVYNVPHVNASDEGNIRVTNRSGRTGTLTGSLRGKDNVYVFENLNLLNDYDTYLATFGKAAEVPNGEIKNNQTVRFTPEYFQWLAKLNDDDTEGLWAGRGVLNIGSDLSKMEVFLLLRSKPVDGVTTYPLLNLSTGATGNGCN